MKTFAQNYKPAIAELIKAELGKCLKFLNKLPTHIPTEGKSPPEFWSCHALTRAFAEISEVDWQIVDGWFMNMGQEHSWLQHPEQQLILDVYPIAAFSGPAAYSTSGLSPWRYSFMDLTDPRTFEKCKAEYEKNAQEWAEEFQSPYTPERLELFANEACLAADIYKKSLENSVSR